MKKSIFSTIMAMLLGVSAATAGEPTIATLSLQYDALSEKFTVFASFDADGPLFIGSSLISVMLPASAGNQPIIVQPINGGAWADLSQTYNVLEMDYHGIITTGTGNISVTQDVPIPIFSFTLKDATVLPETVRLWDVTKDASTTSDGTDYISNFYVPHTGYYIQTENLQEMTFVNDIFPAGTANMNLFPNPANEHTLVTIGAAKESTPVILELISLEGKLLKTNKLTLSKQGDTSFQLALGQIPEGMYFVTLRTQDNLTITSEKLVKVNTN